MIRARVFGNVLIGGVVSIVVSLGTGCTTSQKTAVFNPHADYETLTQSGEDHHHSVYKAMDRDRQALIEDLDMLFLTDRPSRLTRWHEK